MAYPDPDARRPRVSTAKCPDGTFYGAAWNADGRLIAMSDALASRSAARAWAVQKLPKEA